MERLDEDTAIHLLAFLDSAIHVARASLVSRSWRQFVMEGRLWRRLCLKEYPELERVEKIIEVGPSVKGSTPEEESAAAAAAEGLGGLSFQDTLEKEHRIFCHLYSELSGPPVLKRSCISTAIAASSTDNNPQESIHQTLYPGARAPRDPRDGQAWSYWSSTGQPSTDVPETLTYRLLSPLCVVHEIKVRPFQAEFQLGNPTYSAKRIRFRLGYERSAGSNTADSLQNNFSLPDTTSWEYVWTYESPTYPVEQVDTLQSFKLPQPVLCMGQILQVELMGRVQTQQLDALYYICVCHVSVVGRPISNYDFSYMGDRGGYVLIYLRSMDTAIFMGGMDAYNQHTAEEDTADRAFGWHAFARRVRQLRSSKVLWHNRLFSLVRRGDP